MITTNCSNAYGPWQCSEKLIPLGSRRGVHSESLPIHGDIKHVRDWLHVGDNCIAIRCVPVAEHTSELHCGGRSSEMANIVVLNLACQTLDDEKSLADRKPHATQITYVYDRPRHDRRYSIIRHNISSELGWRPSESSGSGLRTTVRWCLDLPQWLTDVASRACRDWIDRHYAQEATR